jgi:hypothetical protein
MKAGSGTMIMHQNQIIESGQHDAKQNNPSTSVDSNGRPALHLPSSSNRDNQYGGGQKPHIGTAQKVQTRPHSRQGDKEQ